MKKVFLAIIVLALAGCVIPPPGSVPIDQVPMYGGLDRSSIPLLKNADEQLIEGTTKAFGGREKAAAAFVNYAFRLYMSDDLPKAMRRFNQAWLLDPNNPEVYWGFACVLHDWGRDCEALKMVEKALGYGKYIPSLYPDAGRIMALCAVRDKNLGADQRKKLLEQSEMMFAKAEKLDTDKGYVFFSWAIVYYWRGDYAKAWRMVAKEREAGADVDERFLRMLRAKMPEPAVK